MSSAASNTAGVAGIAAAAAAQISAQNLQIAPLRNLDDFALGSARFQIPNMNDFEKWGNRVVKNLLYYQSNYFMLFFAVYGLMAVLNPVKIISGLLVQGKLIAIFFLLFYEPKSSKASFINKRTSTFKGSWLKNVQQKWYLAGALLFGFLLLYWLDAILLSCFALLLPISLTFIHSSLRLRNIRNKVANTMEILGPATPMGIILNALNVTADNLLN